MLADIRDILIIVILSSLIMHGVPIKMSGTLTDDGKSKIVKIEDK